VRFPSVVAETAAHPAPRVARTGCARNTSLARNTALLDRLGDSPCSGFPQDPNHLISRQLCLLHRFLPRGDTVIPSIDWAENHPAGHASLAAAASNEIAHDIRGMELQNLLEDGAPKDFDHLLRVEMRLLGNPCSEAAREEDGLHVVTHIIL
jgi:hypothetical protein